MSCSARSTRSSASPSLCYGSKLITVLLVCVSLPFLPPHWNLRDGPSIAGRHKRMQAVAQTPNDVVAPAILAP